MNGYGICVNRFFGRTLGANQIVLRTVAHALFTRGKEEGAYLVGKFDHGAVASEVIRHEYADSVGILGSRLGVERHRAAVGREDRGVTAAKSVDALLDVAHHKAAVSADQRKNAVLYQIHILIFVNVHRVVLRGQGIGKGRGRAVGIGQKLVEHGSDVVMLQNSARVFLRENTRLVFGVKAVQHLAKLCCAPHLPRDHLGGIFQYFLNFGRDLLAELRSPVLIRRNLVRFVAYRGEPPRQERKGDRLRARIAFFREGVEHRAAEGEIRGEDRVAFCGNIGVVLQAVIEARQILCVPFKQRL